MLALLLGRYAELVLSHFPAASLAPDVEMSVYKTLSGMGFTQPNTILADSSCADELNHDDTQQDITSIFRDRWGEVRSRASSQLWQSAAALLHRGDTISRHRTDLPGWGRCLVAQGSCQGDGLAVANSSRALLACSHGRCSTWGASLACHSPVKQDGGRSVIMCPRCAADFLRKTERQDSESESVTEASLSMFFRHAH